MHARESVTVTAKVSETVERVHFDSGDEVRAGAVLVTLSGNQQQAALQAAEARPTRRSNSTAVAANWCSSS